MFNPPKTIQQAMKRLYGPHPHEAFKVEACAYEVIDPHFGGRQCFNKRGHGPAFLYCRQHAAALTAGQPKSPDRLNPKTHIEYLSALLGV